MNTITRTFQKYKRLSHFSLQGGFGYGTLKGKGYTEMEDVYLLVACLKLGYGNWAQIRKAVRLEPLFRHNWFFKSRNKAELSKRTDQVVALLDKALRKEDDKAAAAQAGDAGPSNCKRVAAGPADADEEDSKAPPSKKGKGALEGYFKQE
jgi:hypothetical protein